MVDVSDSKSLGATHESSSLSIGTKYTIKKPRLLLAFVVYLKN